MKLFLIAFICYNLWNFLQLKAVDDNEASMAKAEMHVVLKTIKFGFKMANNRPAEHKLYKK